MSVEALTLALEIEKAELKVYIEIAKRAKRMFLFLAGEEAEHWDVLRRSL